MPTTEASVFIDTNILVYANLALSPSHVQAVEQLQSLDEETELWISRQVFREYLAAMIRQGDLTGKIPSESGLSLTDGVIFSPRPSNLHSDVVIEAITASRLVGSSAE